MPEKLRQMDIFGIGTKRPGITQKQAKQPFYPISCTIVGICEGGETKFLTGENETCPNMYYGSAPPSKQMMTPSNVCRAKV